jgi:hypothetical protein
MILLLQDLHDLWLLEVFEMGGLDYIQLCFQYIAIVLMTLIGVNVIT